MEKRKKKKKGGAAKERCGDEVVSRGGIQGGKQRKQASAASMF